MEEEGTLHLEEGILPLGEGILPLGQDKHLDSQTVGEGKGVGRVGGDQEGGREQKVKLHRDLVVLLAVGMAGVVGHMGWKEHLGQVGMEGQTYLRGSGAHI